MVELVVSRADVSNTTRLVARSTSTTKDLITSVLTAYNFHVGSCTYLQNIQHRQVHKGTFRTVVHLGTLDDNGMRWQIDTPRQCRCTA